MSIKHPTFRGQTCDQEAALQRTFHLERSGPFRQFVSQQCSSYNSDKEVMVWKGTAKKRLLLNPVSRDGGQSCRRGS